ncbi:MAG: uroporphyrinogen-III C-methyltransferase [Planctomycetia bacterium]|nr:uroporphyrinogen-III C-methyltransferase [Planctomycetia bacterium]
MNPPASPSPDRNPPASDRASETELYPQPQVSLVGAGPGDPRLITLRGVERLQAADVVLYDYLVNAELLEHCRCDAELICLGKHGRDRILSQAEINARMTAAGLAGKRVVRLKGGDPAVFARFGEERDALEAAGLTYEVVPGITTALAAGSHAGIALTDRHCASAVALVTGHEQDEQQATKLDYGALAQFPGTLVFYMGVTNAAEWTGALIAAGKPASTPVAVVRRCSWPDQTTLITTLGEVAATMRDAKLRPPVLTIVGETVDSRSTHSWFTERPLFGQKILVTRPTEQATAVRNRLRELGAEVLIQPAIEIGEPESWELVDEALRNLKRFDWMVFSSVNGVRAVMGRLRHLGLDARSLAPVRLAAIGPGTADCLNEYQLRADLVPQEFRAEALAAELAAEIVRGRSRFLLIRASRGREILADTLRAAGGEVEQVVAYRSTDVAAPQAEIAAALAAGKIDWVSVTSSAIARSLAVLFGDGLRKTKLASISPITSAVLRELGYEPAAEATTYTLDGVVAAILKAKETS